MTTSYNIVQYYNQGLDTDKSTHSTASNLSPSQPVATINLFFISLIMFFCKYCINEYISFWGWLVFAQHISFEGHPSCTYLWFLFFFNFYFFMIVTERERERGRDTGRGRSRLHAGSPIGTRSRVSGITPRLQVAPNCCATGAARDAPVFFLL